MDQGGTRIKMKSGNTSIWRKGRGRGTRVGYQEGVNRRITRREQGSGNQGRGRISRRECSIVKSLKVKRNVGICPLNLALRRYH